jgi:hypothetical protein
LVVWGEEEVGVGSSNEGVPFKLTVLGVLLQMLRTVALVDP